MTGWTWDAAMGLALGVVLFAVVIFGTGNVGP